MNMIPHILQKLSPFLVSHAVYDGNLMRTYTCVCMYVYMYNVVGLK